MRIVLLAIAIIMIDGFDLQAIGFVAPEIARDWAMPMAAFGPVFSAGLAGSMLGAMMAGPIARRLEQRLTLALSLLIFGAGTWVTAWAGDLIAMAALRFIVGVGVGAAAPLVMSIVADNSPERHRATLVVITLCGQPIGAILGGALCAHYMPIHGWQFAFHLGGVLPLLLVGAVFLFPAGATPAPGTGRLRELFSPALLPTTALLWLCSFFTVCMIYLIVNWLPAAVRDAGYSLETSVLAIGLFNFGGIGGAVLAGALMDRYGPLKIMPSVFALAALTMATLDAATSTPAVFLTVSCLSGFFGYGGGACLGSLAVMLYPRILRPTGAGWALGIGRLGAAIGPLGASAALAAGLSIGRLFYFAAGAALLVMFLLSLLARIIGGTRVPARA